MLRAGEAAVALEVSNEGQFAMSDPNYKQPAVRYKEARDAVEAQYPLMDSRNGAENDPIIKNWLETYSGEKENASPIHHLGNYTAVLFSKLRWRWELTLGLWALPQR